MENKQIVSRDRVRDQGEVFTNEREVNAMLDLVKNETERIDSNFLEPACGKGAFLTEILNRKLNILEKKYSKNKDLYKFNLLIVVSSLYGIDILEDNVLDCRENLLNITKNKYKEIFKENLENNYLDTIKFILKKNIIFGDALTLLRVDGSKEPIVFSQWSFFKNDMVKRRDFVYSSLIEDESKKNNIFSPTIDGVYIPRPIKDFPLINFLSLKDVES